ncbi:MAG TPA: PilZ domain-containing protein [Thermoanaerobaculia bacterium]|jgi:CheY-like chemotaxis protein|nr:PilZ domain-containing protein [Thermoanaerobaculia bacterium]
MPYILLVDDSGLFRGAAEEVLKRTGCETLTASGGTEALDLARRVRPQMIVVKAGITPMTGIDLCRVLKADPEFAKTPIALVGPPGTEDAAQRVGADAMLPLPLDPEDFFAVIRRFLQVLPREEARAAVEWSVTFWRDGMQHTGTIRDLSRGGFFVRTQVRQPIGARLDVSFDVPVERGVKTIVAEAIIVRLGRENDQGLGCRFFQLSAASRQNLEECLRILALGDVTSAQ